MKFIDLKRSKKERAEGVHAPAGIEDPYPYGLRVHLDQEELDKLGLDIDQFDVGDEISFMAKGEIVSISENQSQNSESQSLSIQIQEMACEEAKQSFRDAYQMAKKKMDRKKMQMDAMEE